MKFPVVGIFLSVAVLLFHSVDAFQGHSLQQQQQQRAFTVNSPTALTYVPVAAKLYRPGQQEQQIRSNNRNNNNQQQNNNGRFHPHHMSDAAVSSGDSKKGFWDKVRLIIVSKVVSGLMISVMRTASLMKLAERC